MTNDNRGGKPSKRRFPPEEQDEEDFRDMLTDMFDLAEKWSVKQDIPLRQALGNVGVSCFRLGKLIKKEK